MKRKASLQSEILVHLALVMVAATSLLAVFCLHAQRAQVEALSGLLGRALMAQANGPVLALQASTRVRWWLVEPGSVPGSRNAQGYELDPAALSLAREVAEGRQPLLQAGSPWEPLRFAAPLADGATVAVAVIPAVVSRTAVAGLMLADCVVFTLLGLYLLRKRVVQPLRQLTGAARGVGEGNLSIRVPVEGQGEAAELAAHFNEMVEQLETRSLALEKAIFELRDTNARLRTARDGLDRAERLAAVGTLAAGVAHEVGNPMGALLAFQGMALADPGLSEAGRGHLAKATAQGERVRRILRQLLDFSRPPRSQKRPVDLHRAAVQTVGLVRAQARYRDIEFEIEAAPELPPAAADESILAQILLNLIVNAADATASASPRRVRLRFTPAPLQVRAGESRQAGAAERAHADGVACVVEDNGPGVPPEDRSRIFDPFFTTKDPGEGTGLGLANAVKLAEEFGGAIDVGDSAELGGAAFTLTLPSALAADAAGWRRG